MAMGKHVAAMNDSSKTTRPGESQAGSCVRACAWTLVIAALMAASGWVVGTSCLHTERVPALPDPPFILALAKWVAIAAGCLAVPGFLAVRRLREPASASRPSQTPARETACSRRWCEIMATLIRSAAEARSQDQFLLDVCRALANRDGFTLCFIRQHSPSTQALRTVAYHGDVRVTPLDEISATDGKGPSSLVMQTRKMEICNDVDAVPLGISWRTFADQQGIKSAAVLPLWVHDRVWGVLSIYDSKPGAFGELEIRFLEQVTAVLSQALEKSEERMREARLREELRCSEERLSKLAKVVPGIVYQFRVARDGKPYHSYISPRAAEMGLSTDPAHPDWKVGARIHPADRERFLASVARSIMERTDWHFEGRALAPNGAETFVRVQSALSVAGDELVYDGVILDVTKEKFVAA